MNKVYVAGPMRGLPGWNFPAFDSATKVWETAGWHVFSPAHTCRALGYALVEGEDPNAPCGNKHLRHVISTDIACIMAANALALLPGWEKSTGATLELALSQFLSLPIYNAETMERIYPVGKPWSLVRSMLEIKNMKEDYPLLSVPQVITPQLEDEYRSEDYWYE